MESKLGTGDMTFGTSRHAAASSRVIVVVGSSRLLSGH